MTVLKKTKKNKKDKNQSCIETKQKLVSKQTNNNSETIFVSNKIYFELNDEPQSQALGNGITNFSTQFSFDSRSIYHFIVIYCQSEVRAMKLPFVTNPQSVC